MGGGGGRFSNRVPHFGLVYSLGPAFLAGAVVTRRRFPCVFILRSSQLGVFENRPSGEGGPAGAMAMMMGMMLRKVHHQEPRGERGAAAGCSLPPRPYYSRRRLRRRRICTRASRYLKMFFRLSPRSYSATVVSSSPPSTYFPRTHARTHTRAGTHAAFSAPSVNFFRFVHLSVAVFFFGPS